MIGMYEDYNYHNTFKDYAELNVGKWFAENHLQIVGTKTVDNYMYVKGFDNVSHASAYAKIDTKKHEIVDYYNARMCTVEVKDGIYE